MKLYVSGVVKYYRDEMSGKANSSLHIVQCCRACAVGEDDWDIPMNL